MKIRALLTIVLVLPGCASAWEGSTRRDLDHAGDALADFESGGGDAEESEDAPQIDGTRQRYVLYALASHPALRAHFERWRAATLRISSGRRIPEPVITYGVFLRSVETRVGPQRHRLGVMQQLPWPEGPIARSDAAGARARAAQRRFEAEALMVRRRVEDTWLRLWRVRREREILREVAILLEGLSEAARARVETGRGALAEVLQIDLARARVEDAISGSAELERATEAELAAAVGVRGPALPTVGAPPPIALPVDDAAHLERDVAAHPSLDALARMAEASDHDARAWTAERFPSFTLGAEWIEVGEAAMPVAGSGDDAVALSIGVRIPIFQELYDDAERAARADRDAYLADAEDARARGVAEMRAALSTLRDSARRAALYQHTLLPQAHAALESVLGAYASGGGSVAAALLAQREILEIDLAYERARAEHGAAWARLEAAVGRTLERAATEEARDE